MPNRHYWMCDAHSPKGIIRYDLIRTVESDPKISAKKYLFEREHSFMLLINPRDSRDSETKIFQSNRGKIFISNGQISHIELQNTIPFYRCYIEKGNLPEELRSELIYLLNKTEEELKSKHVNSGN